MQFDITIQTNFWNKSPSLVIKFDKKPVLEVSNFESDRKRTLQFNLEVTEGDHQLIIERKNKPIKDTVLKDGKIIKDSTVNLVDIVIDKISIEPLLDKAKFFPKYPEPWLTQQKQNGQAPPTMYDYCRTLHHNGDWILDFTTPIHVWFFQNIAVEI